jgi:hypothetical protein
MVRAEVPASTLAGGTRRGALGSAIQSFVASADLQELTRP